MTDVLRVDPENPDGRAIARAAELLRSGGLVAFPTETVYGLGAHALDRQAVRRIFDAKQRPATDPLIVHVRDLADAAPLVRAMPEAASRLAARFWPGPLTLVLPRSDRVPDEVTAGLDTVGIRVPAHAVARALLAAAAIPIAAPSANLFSRPSPTRAAHVLQDLAGRIDLVLDAGSPAVGVESTVLDLSGPRPVVLRPGAVSVEMLRELLPDVSARGGGHAANAATPMPSPGMLEKHYSPRAPLTLYEGEAAAMIARMARDAKDAAAAGQRVGILAADDDAIDGVVVRVGPAERTAVVATRLYAALRELDASGVDLILARSFPTEDGLGVALRDRLRRAAGRIVTVGT